MELFKTTFSVPPLKIQYYVIAESFDDAKEKSVQKVQEEYPKVKADYLNNIEKLTGDIKLIR